ncbi:WD40/YVTN/BNR-like repeat-containing protein [Chloroflexota bacterium]
MAKYKVLIIALMLTLLLSTAVTANSAIATPEEVKWSRVNLPTDGETGNWVLASGSNVQRLTMAADGSLYCYANPSGTSYTLFKSTDAGYNWSAIGMVADNITSIATAADNASIIYYATASNVYKSTDAGASFNQWSLKPGGAGSNNIEIISIDIARLESNIIIAVGTRDTDSSQYGGVYILDENEPLTGWINTNLGNYDVYAVAFSPNFATDRQLVAVASDETDTLITSRIDNGNWGTIIGDATIAGLTPSAVTIAFPDDYDATTEDYTLFLAMDTGSNNGDVYRVKSVCRPSAIMGHRKENIGHL